MSAFARAFGTSRREEGPKMKSWGNVQEDIDAQMVKATKKDGTVMPEQVIAGQQISEGGGYAVVALFKKNEAAGKSRLLLRELRRTDEGRWVSHPNVNLNTDNLGILARICSGILIDEDRLDVAKDVVEFAVEQIQKKADAEED